MGLLSMATAPRFCAQVASRVAPPQGVGFSPARIFPLAAQGAAMLANGVHDDGKSEPAAIA
jgi:hypothetical protein